MTEPTPETPVTPEAPTPGSPEYDVAHVENWAKNNPERIPEQFGGDADKFVESYKQLQAKLTQTSQENAQLKAAPAPEPEPEPDPVETLAIPETETPADPEISAEDWGNWGTELNSTGQLSDETRSTIREKYQVPDEIIDSFVEGRQAQAAKQAETAAGMVGGTETLSGIINWASKNLSEPERNQMNIALSQPGWETVLLGLRSRYMDSAPMAKEPKSGSVGEAGRSSATVESFNTSTEMMEAIRDPRYHSNKDGFRDEVMRRIAATNQNKRRLG